MDDPMMLALVAGLVVAIVGLVLVKKKQAAGGDTTKGKKNVANKNKAKAKTKTVATSEESTQMNAQSEVEEETWDWSVSSHVVDEAKVSVQEIDALTEFNVYKQFGYYEKAAESLSLYLQNNSQKTGLTLSNELALASELVQLWLEAKNADAVAETLMRYQSLYTQEQLTDYVKAGLALDEHHLGLRVLAENSLGWTVKQTAEEIGEKTIQQAPERNVEDGKGRTGSKQEQSVEPFVVYQPLVAGVASLTGLDAEEKGAVLAFMNPEKSVRLLRDSLTYDAAVKYLNKAIRGSAKPAALLIDALTLDYRAKNLNGFASHLWNLYYSLGQYGRQVKERMLGWGYTLGQHPLFERLETNPSDAVVREIGMQQGFIDGGSSKKSRYQALVSEKADVNAEPRTPVERILKEAESLLMYGQLENSMELLENSILEYPQESQLYITLFDLYERAEEWGRLEEMLQKLRSQVQTLPEEVVLAMSQLLQRFNNGSFGN